MPSNHLILCCPLLLLPSIFPSVRVFSSESAVHIRWPTYWCFSFSISPSNECSGLISFRIDWFDLLAVQRTLKSPPAPQFENIYSLALCLLYGPALTTICDSWKDHSFNYTDICWQSDTFVGKVMSLLFNTLPKFFMASLPWSNHLLISRLQSTICSEWLWSPRRGNLSLLSPFPLLFAMK